MIEINFNYFHSLIEKKKKNLEIIHKEDCPELNEI